jgi:hypothetical protein
MKFLPSIKSVKAICLAAVTIATTVASNITPSQAGQANRVIHTSGQPDLLVLDGDLLTFTIGCSDLRRIWQNLPTQEVSPAQYKSVFSGGPHRFVAHLNCNNPTLVQSYTSPAFGGRAGLMVSRGSAFYVSSLDIMRAMGIRPTALSAQQGNVFLQKNGYTHILDLLEPGKFTPYNSLTLRNRGAYVSNFTVTSSIGGNRQTLHTGNLVVGQQVVIKVPLSPTNINVEAKLFTGLGAQTKTIFNQRIDNNQASSCLTTVGTVFNGSVNNSCN